MELLNRCACGQDLVESGSFRDALAEAVKRAEAAEMEAKLCQKDFHNTVGELSTRLTELHAAEAQVKELEDSASICSGPCHGTQGETYKTIMRDELRALRQWAERAREALAEHHLADCDCYFQGPKDWIQCNWCKKRDDLLAQSPEPQAPKDTE